MKIFIPVEFTVNILLRAAQCSITEKSRTLTACTLALRQLPVFCTWTKSLWLSTTHSTHQTIQSAIVIQTLPTHTIPYQTLPLQYYLLLHTFERRKKHLSKADQVSGQSKVCVTEKTSVATSNSLSASIFLSQWIYGQSVIGFSKAYSCHGMRLPSPFSDNASSRSQSLIIIIIALSRLVFSWPRDAHIKKNYSDSKEPPPPSPKGALVAFL